MRGLSPLPNCRRGTPAGGFIRGFAPYNPEFIKIFMRKAQKI